MALILRQGQVWKGADEFVRIVQLERLEVKYKTMPDLSSGKGEHRTGTKKEFCRMIKGYTLLNAKGRQPGTDAGVSEAADSSAAKPSAGSPIKPILTNLPALDLLP
mgnify:CR=1 FL=1